MNKTVADTNHSLIRETAKLPSIIDIEASGFGANSYPIEIGVVRYDGERYCRLIKPFDNWQDWQNEAAAIHQISRQQLETCGAHGTEICLQLNAFLQDSTVYSDGWQVDSSWLNTLFDRAKVRKTFRISSLEMILSEHQMNIWHSTKQAVIKSLNLSRHRASNDALIIQHTFLQSRANKGIQE